MKTPRPVGFWATLQVAEQLPISECTVRRRIRDADAGRMSGCSKATLLRRLANGTIPRPLEIGGMRRWPKSETEVEIELANAKPSSQAPIPADHAEATCQENIEVGHES